MPQYPQPNAPTTDIHADAKVELRWTMPTSYERVSNYVIEFTTHSKDWETELIHCNGANSTVMTTRSCKVPLDVLMAEPFALKELDTIYARVTVNYTNSTIETSNVGGSAFIPIPTSPPVNLARVEADCKLISENEVQVGFSWEAPLNKKQSLPIAYKIWFD